ncbi:hypothetical protein FS749_008544 [Ceratobasidium sp. UAMH 11750]|nr:hypothetical protein FS749_008544 [Ceratobasidium sp. UAMH 11750]
MQMALNDQVVGVKSTINSSTIVGTASHGLSLSEEHQFADDDEEMAGQSDEDDAFSDASLEETTYLKRLKDLYAEQPNSATQKALLVILEELSREAEAEKDGHLPKRRKRRSGLDSEWDQSQEYVCMDGPCRREKQRVALSGYIRLILWQFLKLSDKKSQLPPGPPPEVAAPTSIAFYIKWDESEKSEFNAIAARIVALQVVADYPSLCTLDEMHEMVTCHVKYLRAHY